MKTKIILLLSLALVLPAWAGVLPNDAIVDGRSLSEWTAEWWKWVFSVPTNENPHLDASGRWANAGQPDAPVFFLGGSAGLSPDTIVRTFTVPEDKFLLVPVLVAQADNIDTFPPLATEELRNLLRGFVDAPRELHAMVDQMAVSDLVEHRVESGVFTFEFFNPDNFKTFGQGHPILGLVDPVLSDGYWLMIEPLPVGVHVLHYGGTWNLPFFFPNDIVANITVVPISLQERVESLMTTVAAANLSPKSARPLLSALRGAAKSFERGHVRSGIHHLRAFQKKVHAQIAPDDQGLASRLIQSAQGIIERANRNLKCSTN